MADAVALGLDLNASGQRPMIAILIARPGSEQQMRELLICLAQDTRKESGCVAFLLHEALNSPGTFYLYEVYRSNLAFSEHLKSQTVTRFKQDLASVSDSSQDDDLTQLVEIS